ncbi:MAG: S24 family peptidase [Sphingomonadales bacterium]|nr:S24 family peptidase [Sphingomonadales bacterium]MDE2168569.1 S24 family peptidase [Sphingomonadales bacterium]
MNAPDPRARLLDLAGDKGVSLASLSALIGRNPAYLQQFVKKGSPRKLEEGDRAKLARFLGVDEVELGGAKDFSSALRRKDGGDWVDVPRLALDASAGPGAVAQEEAPFGQFRYARSWLRGQGLDAKWLSVIAVVGDSMVPTLYDGDEILIDASPRPWRDGVHVLRLGDALLVKRLVFERPGHVRVISDNRSYDRYDLSLADVTIIGRVVWKCGRI